MYAKSISKHLYYSFDRTQMPYAFFHNLAPNDLPRFRFYTVYSSWTVFSSSKISCSPSLSGLCTCYFLYLTCSSPFFFTWPSLTHSPSLSHFSRSSFLNPKTGLCVFPMSFHSKLCCPVIKLTLTLQLFLPYWNIKSSQCLLHLTQSPQFCDWKW